MILLALPRIAVCDDTSIVDQTVIDGMEEVAEENATLSMLVSYQMFGTGMPAGESHFIYTRLEHKYVKREEIATNFQIEKLQRFVFDSTMYDGNDYFHVARDDINEPFQLKSIGNPEAQPNVGLKVRDSSYGCWPLKYIVTVRGNVRYTPADNRSSLAQLHVTFPDTDVVGDVRETTVYLDPKNRFRIVKEISPVGGSSTLRIVTQREYFPGTNICSKTTSVWEQKRSNSEEWEEYRKVQSINQLLPTDDLTPKDFSIEHYGLPPYKRRASYFWWYVAFGGLGMAMLFCGVVLYRKRG